MNRKHKAAAADIRFRSMFFFLLCGYFGRSWFPLLDSTNSSRDVVVDVIFCNLKLFLFQRPDEAFHFHFACWFVVVLGN